MTRLNDSRIGTLLGDRFAVRASARTVSTLHAQHGAALFVTLETPLTVVDTHGNVARGHVVLVPPDLENTVLSAGPTIGICYDPERLPRLAARSRARGSAQALDGRLAHKLVEQAISYRAQLEQPDVLRGIADEAADWLGTETARAVDTRVAAVIEALRDHDEAMPQLPISRAHLAELFARDVGTSMRSYRLWRRLLRALVAFTRSDATTAAHAAGFADLAHFSRTCRRMLGYTPTALRDGV
ncbi:MAG TPA: helix-turn-helix domain-containing protein [Kofleriaceae bacterium]